MPKIRKLRDSNHFFQFSGQNERRFRRGPMSRQTCKFTGQNERRFRRGPMTMSRQTCKFIGQNERRFRGGPMSMFSLLLSWCPSKKVVNIFPLFLVRFFPATCSRAVPLRSQQLSSHAEMSYPSHAEMSICRRSFVLKAIAATRNTSPKPLPVEHPNKKKFAGLESFFW